jgi:hypothetical protein
LIWLDKNIYKDKMFELIMIKRSDKRGEGPAYSGTLIIISLLVLALVLFAIIGISNAAEKGLTTFGISMIDEKAAACKIHATSALKDSFCGYRKIDKNTYMNCLFLKVKERLIEGGLTEGQINAIGCKGDSEGAKEFCENVCKEKIKDGSTTVKFSELMTVNGNTCKQWGVSKEDCDKIKT